MRSRIGAAPARHRARQVSPWLATVPRRCREICRALDVETVGIASMVMDVVDQRNPQLVADRQQILDGVHPIVILEGDERTRTR